ncbi:MAG: nicotinamide mononucleotide transporter [Prevotellaceae bacterium]|nr:nicotinamide mononucleotide transporter [Prevotellaceae bacterium]
MYILDNWLEVLGTVTGIIYLYQELKASIYMWVTGIIMPAISIFVYYEAGLYADLGINIYYCIAAIYGFLVWQFGKKKEEKSLPITRTPRRKYGQLTLCFVLCFVLIGIALTRYTDSTVPWWDSFTTSLSVVGMWMLARKWIEQWWVWVAVDAVSTFLYIYKGIYFYAALYGIYTIIAIYGYFKWKRLMTA